MSNSSPLHTKIQIQSYEDILKHFHQEGTFSHPSGRTNILSQTLPGSIVAIQIGADKPRIYTGVKYVSSFVKAASMGEGRELQYKVLGRVTPDLILEIYH
jgi:hypothetical protein